MGKVAAIKLVNFYIVIFSLLIAGTTIVGVLSPFFDPRDYSIIPFIGLILPIILILNILSCIYLLVTKRFIVASIIAITFCIGFLGAGYKLPKSSKTIDSAEKNIRVMTFNISQNNAGNNNYDDLQAIVEFAKTENVDIFCIQEYPDNNEVGDSLRKCLSFLPYYTFPENVKGYLKVAIFSRYPIQNIKQMLFKNSYNSAITTDLLIENKTIRLICAHLQTTNFNQKRIGSIWNTPSSLYKTISKMNVNQRIRASQADLIREEIRLSTTPVIFCGDMNDTPTSYTYKTIKKDLQDGFEECGNGIGHTYKGLFSVLRIDYILYSKEISGIKYESPKKVYSDHNPVIMDLVLNY